MSPTDLIAELRAALDTVEATARAAAERGDDPAWHVMEDGKYNKIAPGADTPPGIDLAIAATPGWEYAAHIVRHDPAFVLADIAAKRKLIDAHDRPHECIDLTGSGEHSAVDGRPWELWETQHTEDEGRPCFTIRTLAEAYGIYPEGATT